MDVLADMLIRARAQGALFAHSTLRGPWGLEFSDDGVPLSVHAVLEGEVWVELDGDEGPPLRLLGGDLLLVRSARPYRFLHAPGAAARPLAAVISAAPGARQVEIGSGDGEATELLCGAYTFAGHVCDGLLASLPERAVLPADGRLRTAISLLGEEIAHPSPGQQTVLDRLLDLILVYGLRAWFSREEASAPRWFRALDDPAIGPALRALHADPARAWTVADLAGEAGLSRAALARRFNAVLGEPPLAYLTGWRMGLAREALLRPGATLASVAAEIGYGTEFAFAAAFKREVGEAPGRWRAGRAEAVSDAGRAARTR